MNDSRTTPTTSVDLSTDGESSVVDDSRVVRTQDHGGVARRRRLHVSEFSWIWVSLALLLAVCLVLAPESVATSSLTGMLPFAGIVAIAAVGQTLVVQQRGIDFSVPGGIALGGILAGYFTERGVSLTVAIIFTVTVGVCAGLLNGFFVVRLRVTPLIATLASNALLLGAAREVTQGFPVRAPRDVADFATGSTAGVSNSFLLALAFILMLTVVVRWTVIGRRFVAVGANARAARASGIPAAGYVIATYGAAGMCYAVAGVLVTGMVGTGTVTMGDQYLLPTIAAVVVGGTPFTGGRGSLVATAAGALFLSQLSQLVLSMGASNSAQLLVQATVLVAAVGVRQLAVVGARMMARVGTSPAVDPSETSRQSVRHGQ